MIPLGNGVFVEVDEIDLLPALLHWSWSLSNSGYAHGDNELLHTFIVKRMGLVVTETVDHKDRNKLNCRRSNLQLASRSEQLVNRRVQDNNKSGHKLIHWYKPLSKWRVQIKRLGKYTHIGFYVTLDEAVTARDAYLKLHNLELK